MQGYDKSAYQIRLDVALRLLGQMGYPGRTNFGRAMKHRILAYFLSVAVGMIGVAHGYTIRGKTYATDGSQRDVDSAIGAARSGSTIVIPSGSFSWSSGVTIRKSLTLQGTGVRSTKISSQMTSGNMISATAGKDGHIVISGINFVQVGNNGGGKGFTLACDRDDRGGKTVMVHDCTFDGSGVYAYTVLCQANGILFWNDTFIGDGVNGLGGISMVCQKYGPGTRTGRGAWNTASTMGMDDKDGLNNTYVEDCTLSNGPTAMINADDNSRVVIRHCTVIDSDLHAHGQDTSIYGVRHCEIYNNTFKNQNAGNLNLNSWSYMRGGVFVFANNVIDAPPYNKPTLILITQSANRADAIPCQTAYPAARQVGQGWSATSNAAFGNPAVASNGKGAILDPCYVWGNTGSGGDNFGSEVAVQTYSPDDCGNGMVGSTFIRKGRDYYMGTPKPGWTPYTYPHPLRTATSTDQM
jgi:hypothetical protein